MSKNHKMILKIIKFIKIKLKPNKITHVMKILEHGKQFICFM